MTTVAGVTVSADSFVLGGTLGAVPDAEFSCEPTVASGDGVDMPLLRATAADRESLEQGLANDETVERFDRLADFDGEYLYRVQWDSRFHLVLQLVASENATIVDAEARQGEWALRMLYPDRDALARAHDACLDHGIELELGHVSTLDGEEAERFGITGQQREALLAACERGYFDIPRQVGLRDLAEDLDISHQALSERLRRGHDGLIRKTLGGGTSL
ncbi:helix-turn-helix domain-containing protein [Halomarina litorea]|uniref:helix-turn-helix domain-containing protein n=1 Tax=Halomarina litorea TaxID=2961595 RepID=UPI0020C35E2B|nr:helix-turn-helix domain-containing protein [Halomarina sp. BCD28]